MLYDIEDETFFSLAPVGIARLDCSGGWRQVNRHLCEILGLSAPTLGYLKIHHITHPEDLKTELAQMALLQRRKCGRFSMAKRFIRGDGTILWADVNVSYIATTETRDGHFIAVIQDISETRKHIEDLERKLRHDPLTSVRNRAGLAVSLRNAFRRHSRHGRGFALAYIDLDGFKQINDTFGHVCGDMLLKDVADRLRRMIGEDGVVARLSGDEFAVVLKTVDSDDMLNANLYRLNAVFSAPFEIEQQKIAISASIGLARCPEDARSVQHLMQIADAAMYKNKTPSTISRPAPGVRMALRASR